MAIATPDFIPCKPISKNFGGISGRIMPDFLNGFAPVSTAEFPPLQSWLTR